MVLAVSAEPTLRKVGAHIRWLLEKNGIPAEHCIINLIMPNIVAESAVISMFLKDFDPTCMRHVLELPKVVNIHGVPFVVSVAQKPVALA